MVSLTIANRDSLVAGRLSESDNSCDGHTLARTIEQVQRLTGCSIGRSCVNRGDRGHRSKKPQVLIFYY